MSDHANARSVLQKIIITGVFGVLSFPITDMIFSTLPQQFAMAAGFGAIALLIQFLIDFDKRLHQVEVRQEVCVEEIRRAVQEGFAKVNESTLLVAEAEEAGLGPAVTELVRRASKIGPDESRLARAFALTEINRLSRFFREFADHEAAYDGEDRDWLLGLTRCAEESIDAISIPEVDSAGHMYHSFWQSELGRRYVDLQGEAIQRGVKVRRVFVTERDEMAGDLALQRICRVQTELGIEVRLLYPSVIPTRIHSSLFDFILFDYKLSYESTPAPHIEEGGSPIILHTRLNRLAAKVAERIERYESIWESAVPWRDVDSTQTRPVSSAAVP